MKKKVMLRSLLGAPAALAIGYAITILISLIAGNGEFLAVAPELTETFGSEINAVMVQAGVSMLYGMVWAGSSVIWEVEDWSILRQSVTHLLITSLTTFPIADYLHWMPHTVVGMLTYFGIFFLVYLVIWLSQYSAMKKRVEQLNSKVKEKNAANR